MSIGEMWLSVTNIFVRDNNLVFYTKYNWSCHSVTHLAGASSFVATPLVIKERVCVVIEGVLTPFFEGQFTLPYKSDIYRDSSGQVQNSTNSDN